MKKIVDFLLILPLLLVIAFIVFAYRTGVITDLYAADTPLPIDRGTVSVTPTTLSAVIPYSASTISHTSTPTLTPAPSSTPAPAITPIPSLTDTPAPTNTSASAATGTPARLEINSGIETGNEIVRAIERFYVDQGHYPAALNELVPTYLPALPATLTGQPYFYRFFDAAHPMASERYWLAFRVIEQENITCTYLRRLEYWDCNYASP
jgi:hypothetical protein